MEKKLEIMEECVVTAYNNASEEQKQVLVGLFGEEFFKSKDVTERIKTFEDACKELGDKHPFVQAYKYWTDGGLINQPDIVAYLKLRIIVTALNEGWEPQFSEYECRYYPWFYLYTKEEIENMDEEKKVKVCGVVGRASNNASASGGLVYSSTINVSAYSFTGLGSRLAFKTEELAKYAGKQFVEAYRDFMIVG